MNGWTCNPVGGYGLVTVTAAVLLVVMMLTNPQMRRLNPMRRWTLVALRLAVFLLVIAALLRPTRIFTEIRERPATLVLLADRSKSMQTEDAFGDRTRWDALRETISQSLSQLSNMGEKLDVKVYTFDRELSPVEFSHGKLDLGKSADGPETAIGAALDDVLRRESGKRLAGVILFSDGAQQAYPPRDLQPQLPARRLNDMPAPLFTITFGQDRSANQSRDVAITDLVVSPSVFIKNELSIAGTARINGLVNQPIPVQVLFETSPGKMEPVASTVLRANQNGEQIKFELSYIPQTPGERKITLRAEPQPGERITTNNELSTFVNVLDGGLNVLYLEGEPRSEISKLRRSLGMSPDIKVDFVYFDKKDRQRWPINMADRLAQGKYNVYIIGDLDSSVFRPEDLQLLRDDVLHGAGLIMLGGFHSFWGGGYQKTALADVLPLQVRPVDQLARQDFDAPFREDLHLKPVPLPNGPGPNKTGVQMLPDKRFGYEPPMRLAAPDQNLAAWQKLPPLEGANKFEALKPAARPLAVTSDGQPLLVAAEPGNGRVLAFAGDSTWRWFMQGFEKEHKRFWRQVVLWLAKKDDTDEQKVWIKLEQRHFPPGARIEFSAGARTTEGEPIEGAAFTATLLSHDGVKQPIALTRQADQYVGQLRNVIEPGDYSISVQATKDGALLGETKARFVVFEQDLELENAAARPELMASLAKLTAESGGEAVAPEQLLDLLKRIKEQPRDRQVATETKFTPWDSPPFFLIVVGLLCAEWYLRKRWGWV
ncbi:MAG TPA: glutamine amidotransferase [Pirellulales bacterium]|nr:glutamine amidotransferase [Pirellulales bacterium]